MKRLLPALLMSSLLLVNVAPAQNQDKDKVKDKAKEPEKDKFAGKLVLSWHGQSFFQIKTPEGTRIVIDPHDIPSYGRILGLKADLALLSHNHTDHTQLVVLDNVKDKNLKVYLGYVPRGKKTDWNLIDTTFKDVKIRTVGVYHDDSEGLTRGKNTIFILEIDGWRIAHLGDLGHVLTAEQVAEIKKNGPIDVLMIPVGGVYSINGREAKKVVKQLEPREYIIPMHYGTPVFDDLLTVGEFLEGQPKESVLRMKDNRLILDRKDKRARPQITVLNYWPSGK